MIVRPLGAADGAMWHAMMSEATRSNPAAFLLSFNELAAITPEQAQARMEQGHLHGLFDEGARLLGFAGLRLGQLDRIRHRADVGPFYVDPAARGTGAADILFEALVDVAQAGQVAWLDLWVAASNTRAIAFYSRHGFTMVGRRADAVRMGDTSEDDLLMTRQLAA